MYSVRLMFHKIFTHINLETEFDILVIWVFSETTKKGRKLLEFDRNFPSGTSHPAARIREFLSQCDFENKH